jgi:C4-dicarboxylate-specific signal transduction histidine kinase
LSSDFDENGSLLGELTSLVCHEINNCLNGIMLQVAVMEQSAGRGDRADISNIRKLAKDAAELVTKLQKHNRYEPLERQSVDIVNLTQSVRDELQQRYPESHIKLDGAHDRCLVQADASTLKRILWLLGWHSVSVASAAKPQITISTRLEKNRCVLTWHDNGPDVADENLERLFDTFQSRREGSDDVSLPVVRLLARRLRGAINAARAPEGGMNFTLELPVA